MKAAVKVENPGSVQVTLTVTLPMADWRKVAAQLEDGGHTHYGPAGRVWNTIVDAVRQVEQEILPQTNWPAQEKPDGICPLCLRTDGSCGNANCQWPPRKSAEDAVKALIKEFPDLAANVPTGAEPDCSANGCQTVRKAIAEKAGRIVQSSSGDTITSVMRRHNLAFPEAVEFIVDRLGLHEPPDEPS
jgi:hypothetical protein